MKTYLIKSPKNIEVVEKEIDELKKDEVLIKIKNIGICGSDVSLFNGSYKGPHKYPLMFGHEWSGIVFKKGNKVKKVKINDKVTGDCSKYCDNCEFCRFDKNLCKNIEKFGITIDGASAEYIVRNENYIYKAPEEMGLDLICLTEPVSVAFHLISKIIDNIKNFNDKKILICGGGTIGLAALLILTNLYNCSDIYLHDINKERLELSKKLGSKILREECLDNKTEKSDYSSIYSSAMFNVIIEATGNSEVFKNILEMVKPMGVIGCLGMTPLVTINQKLIVLKGLTLIGSIGGTGEFDKALDLINNNKESFKKLISHKFSIDNICEAFNEFSIANSLSKIIKMELIL